MARVFRYNGKIYSDAYYTDDTKHYDGDLSDLLFAISKDNSNIYRESTITIRYVGDEYFGTDEDKSDEETLDELFDNGYNEDIDLEEVVEEEIPDGEE